MRFFPIRTVRAAGVARPQYDWLRVALRFLSLGLFVAGRRLFLWRLLRRLMTCLTTLMLSGIFFAALIIWWLMGFW